MSDRPANAPRWMPVCTAVIRLRRQYEQAEIYANEEVCFQVATDTLLRRLRSGQLKGRASKYDYFEERNRYEFDSEDISSNPAPEADGLFSIPTSFWSCLHECKDFCRDLDWIAGDFEYRSDNDFQSHSGTVIGLVVDEGQLPSIGPFDIAGTSGEREGEAGEPKTVGRSAARWWPAFSEELAVYIHHDGIPEGSGHEGQSFVIDAIFKRLAAKGIEEPGRATVQPVINAVIDRIRSAGK